MQPRNIQDDTLRVVCSLHGFSSHNIQAGWQVTTRYESQITYNYKNERLTCGRANPKCLNACRFAPRLRASVDGSYGFTFLFSGVHVRTCETEMCSTLHICACVSRRSCSSFIIHASG